MATITIPDQVVEMIGRIDERLKITAEDVAKLTHVLLEGNGQPSIMSQVATLNEKVIHLEQDDGAKTGLAVARLDERVSAMERTRLTPGEKILLVSALLGGGFSIVDIVLRVLGH